LPAAFDQRDGGGVDPLGGFDGGAGVAEDSGDADLVQPDAGWAERGESVVGIGTEPGSGVDGLADQGAGGVPIAVDGGGVGRGGQQ
jgi:hypothetical protein